MTTSVSTAQGISIIPGTHYLMNNHKNEVQRFGWIHGPQLHSSLESGIDMLLLIPLLCQMLVPEISPEQPVPKTDLSLLLPLVCWVK